MIRRDIARYVILTFGAATFMSQKRRAVVKGVFLAVRTKTKFSSDGCDEITHLRTK